MKLKKHDHIPENSKIHDVEKLKHDGKIISFPDSLKLGLRVQRKTSRTSICRDLKQFFFFAMSG